MLAKRNFFSVLELGLASHAHLAVVLFQLSEGVSLSQSLYFSVVALSAPCALSVSCYFLKAC